LAGLASPRPKHPGGGTRRESLVHGLVTKVREHFRAPVSVLESLVAVRLHIDDCDERNGTLRVVPGSHLLGRLKPELAQEVRRDLGERSVPVPRGGLMAMKPLLLHASSKAMGDGPRRVLHFLFGPPDLPEGLRWPLRRQFAETL